MSASTILHNHPADLVVASATSLRRIFGVAPVSLGAPVTQIKILLQACLDAGRGASNLAGDEGLSAAGRVMVEQYAIGREYSGGASISGTR